jgi:hypothetical protein
MTAAERIQKQLELAKSPDFVKREKELRQTIVDCQRELDAARQAHGAHQERLRPTSINALRDEEHALRKEIRAIENFPDGMSPALQSRILNFIIADRFKYLFRSPVKLDKEGAQNVVWDCQVKLAKAQEELRAHMELAGLKDPPTPKSQVPVTATPEPEETEKERENRLNHEKWLADQKAQLQPKPAEDQ